jgi:hypothetical protein
MQTTLARFDPLATQAPELSDSHYREVHVRLAAELLGSVPTIRQYSTYRVRRQYDATGHWRKHPTAWRFASQLIETAPHAPDGSATTAFPAEVRHRLAQDHRNCLRHLRRFDVENEVLLDDYSGQWSTQRYFIEFERAGDDAAGIARTDFDNTCQALASLAVDAAGLRQIVRRGVLSEAETDPLDDDGQILTGEQLAASTMVGYLDVVFDNQYSAEQFFVRNEVRAQLRSGHFASIEGYEVDEVVGFDHRGR